MKPGPNCRIAGAMLATSILSLASCTTSSEGIDLTERGVLTLVINRVSESAIATAAAQVRDDDSLFEIKIELADDQIISINNVPLTATTRTVLGLDATVASTIESVDAPDSYTVSFDNQGVETTVEIEAPEDFGDVAPESANQVTRDGFDLEWDQLEEDDEATVTISITGLTLSYTDDGALQAVDHVVSLPGLVDDGGVTIGSAQLAAFLSGELTVTLRRTHIVSQKLGFADGTVVLEVDREIALTLID